ncbi:MAG TPA: deoxyribonuclease IV [Solirubrobacteraceae bacterium]|jgi:deoxyribonuclease-4|nr:deoxyribonuclease IV [Solirubrobacteraceae bacterium]
MLVGAHVSPAGGPARAVERGVERGAEAIQFFNQSPRAWRAREYTEEEAAEFRETLAASSVDAAIIHTVYLINCASRDRTIRRKSLNSLTIALRSGAALGVNGVVLHAGSALGGDVKRAVTRAGKVIRAALDDSEGCPLHLEDTAGSGGTLGRSFSELAALIEAAGGDERLGLCLDSCHLWASGYDVRTADGLREVIDECVGMVGVERLGSVHVNDSKTGLGSNVDRHAPLGEGELGANGCAVFLSEPRFDGLPAIFEGPGVEGKAPTKADVDAMKRLRKQGLTQRRR